MGTGSIACRLRRCPGARLVAFACAGADAELLVNATAGHDALDALHIAGEAHLAGKTLIGTVVPNGLHHHR
ncbi:hypothetical protein ACH427_31820 [Streptomyces sp. NPDC020379]|uniref:hypothetical protein n=1 Tax=Streptomyces sp. NPDC020379 TaxID=3365071 RepID=UPI00379C98E4